MTNTTMRSVIALINAKLTTANRDGVCSQPRTAQIVKETLSDLGLQIRSENREGTSLYYDTPTHMGIMGGIDKGFLFHLNFKRKKKEGTLTYAECFYDDRHEAFTAEDFMAKTLEELSTQPDAA